MKNISLTLNVILLAAVGYLYYKVFSNTEKTVMTHQSLPESSIVFVNSDSLLDHYDFFNEMKVRMEHKHDSVEALLKAYAGRLESEVQLYQKQAIGMTDMEKQQKEEGLMQKQQELMQLKENMMGMLAEEEGQLNDSIHNNLVEYLREFNKGRRYNFIFGYQKGGGILLANDSLDITNAVIEGLNIK